MLFVGDGKGADALVPFWRRLRASGAKIRAVATDMSFAYIAAVSDNLKGALHVFDHFHIIKLYNEKLTDLRRALYHEVTVLMHKKILKGTLWLLLKNPENLDPKKNEQGTNNKIKTMKRQAYGFRDHAFFKLKIMGIHETRYELVG